MGEGGGLMGLEVQRPGDFPGRPLHVPKLLSPMLCLSLAVISSTGDAFKVLYFGV